MMNYKRVSLVLIGLILVFELFFIVWRKYSENVVLKQVLRQQEQMIRQKEEQIQQLQEQLEILRKEQVIRERKISVLKKQRMQIQKPQSVNEVVKEFKELGYDAVVR